MSQNGNQSHSKRKKPFVPPVKIPDSIGVLFFAVMIWAMWTNADQPLVDAYEKRMRMEQYYENEAVKAQQNKMVKSTPSFMQLQRQRRDNLKKNVEMSYPKIPDNTPYDEWVRIQEENIKRHKAKAERYSRYVYPEYYNN